ncbi:site-2 protease family protein, partial [Myxococcota bacterium]|nr:site-2 protease family protein [Myxococcota bacterium]
ASILAGFKGAAIFTAQQTNIIWGLLRGTQEGQLSGIPGIIKMVSTQAEQGLRRFLEALAWLSIGLFVLNILPVPALDGSRLVFLSIEGVRRRPVNEQVEGWVHGIGFLLLMGLMIFVSIRDLL